MPLPKDPESRKQIAKAVVNLMKLPQGQRMERLHEEMRRRGLETNSHINPPDDSTQQKTS